MSIHFEHIIMSVILFSITSYLWIAYLNLKGRLSHTHVHQIITTIAVMVILYSAVLLLKGILFFDLIEHKRYPSGYLIPFILVICIFIAVGGAVLWSRSRFVNNVKEVLGYTLCALFLGVASPILRFQYVYYVLLGFHGLVLLLFLSVIITEKKHLHNHGIYFIMGGSAALYLAAILSITIEYHFFNVLSLALMSFILLGFFMFFLMDFMQTLQLKDKDIESLSLIDALTGLPNRLALERKLSKDANDSYFVLLDIKDFMTFNNLLGHSTCNRLLKRISTTLKSFENENVTVYRLYADKFIIHFCGHSHSEVGCKLPLIEKSIHKIWDKAFPVEVCCGVVFFSSENRMRSLEEVLNELEIATEIAKSKNLRIHWYQDGDKVKHLKWVELEIALKQAVENNEFEVYYQPQVSSSGYEIVSFEALIRWQFRETYISPVDFIPIATNKGWMATITKNLIQTLVSDSKDFEFFKGKRLAINLSPELLVDDDFVSYVIEMGQSNLFDASKLVLEITESSLLNDLNKVNKTLRAFKEIGFQIALDDFGDGYSSLYHFSSLDIDEVKFDKKFTDDLSNPKTYNTLKKCAELFKSFDMRVVIEGVETEEQVKIIETLPIDLLQGFYFYRPMRKESYENQKSVL